MSVLEFAERVSASPRTVRRWIAQGLPVGAGRKIDPLDAGRWLLGQAERLPFAVREDGGLERIGPGVARGEVAVRSGPRGARR